MYSFLRQHLPSRVADGLMAVWYAVLLGIIVYYSFEPQADFAYLRF